MDVGGADAHTLVGAYAMDAVSAPDRARFEQHLDGCEACREEIMELREATARLAAAAAVVPRPELKTRALLAAVQTRQLPPVTGAAAAQPTAGPALRRARPGRSARGRSARGRSARGPSAPGPSARGRRLRAPRPRLASLLTAGAAAVVVAVAVLAAVLVQGAQHRLDLAQRRSMAVAQVLNAPDAARLTAQVRTGGIATVVMSHAERRLVFTAAGLRALPAARRYELWLMSPSGAKPAGMLTAAHGGMVSPMVVSGLSAGEQIGITVELAAGAARPTGRAVLLLSLRTR